MMEEPNMLDVFQWLLEDITEPEPTPAEGLKCEKEASPLTGIQLCAIHNSLGRHIYRIHHRPASVRIGSLHAASLQTLHIAAHNDEIEGRILPALRERRIVILDRFWWSIGVYGLAAGVRSKGLRHLVRLESRYWGRVRPAAVFLVRRGSARSCASDEKREKLEREYDVLMEREHRKYLIHVRNNNGTVVSRTARRCGATSKATTWTTSSGV